MIQKREPILVLIIIILLSYILASIFNKPNENTVKPPYWESSGFKTDTIIASTTYYQKDTFKIQIPPITLVKWLRDTSYNSLRYNNDSLLYVVDSLNCELANINTMYLLQYPVSPKLIGAKLKLDTMSFDLLNINGNITTSIYPTDYYNFEYQYINNTIRANKIKTNKPQNKTRYHELYVSGGYDLVQNKPTISTDY
jgi:hypothetical protein